MEMTGRRWVAGLTITLAALAVYFARADGKSRENPHGWNPTTLREERRSHAYQDAQRYGELLRVLAVRDSVRAKRRTTGGDPFDVRIDPAFSAPLRATISAKVQSTRQRLAIAPAYPITVAVVRDTVHVMRGLHVGRIGILKSSSLPTSAADPCLVLILVREPDITLRQRIESWSKSGYEQPQSLGICGFAGRFGAPGAGMSQWISARWHDQVNPDLGSFDRRFRRYAVRGTRFQLSWWSGLDDRGVACGAGRLDVCRDIALADTGQWALISEREHLTGVSNYSNFYSYRGLGADENNYLGDLARSLGPERFAKLWKSNEDLSTAFAAATGKDIGAWTHDWIVDTYGPQAADVAPSAFSLMAALGLVGASIAAAMILAERRRFI